MHTPLKQAWPAITVTIYLTSAGGLVCGVQFVNKIKKLGPSVFPPSAEEIEWMNLDRWCGAVALATPSSTSFPFLH
jgi:hypothetical protein